MKRIALLLTGAALALSGCSGLPEIFSDDRRPATTTDTTDVAAVMPEAETESVPLPRPKPPITNAEVLSLQIGLQRLGFEPGPADGVLGPLTQEALRTYQRTQGLPVDGTVTRALIQIISAEVSEAEQQAQPPQATIQTPEAPPRRNRWPLLDRLFGS
jgi:peptidoglycan hydrolase-like protein with peptidoglycan-binding domain